VSPLPADHGEDAFVVVARVVKAVGMRGEVKLLPADDWHPPLLGSRFLRWDDGTPARVLGGRPQAGGWVVRIAGVLDREAAERQVGRRLGFRRGDYRAGDFPRPSAGLPFRFAGREVVDTAGRLLGTVGAVNLDGPVPLLELRGDDGRRRGLVPAVPPILRDDPGLDGPLVVDPPEGLLDDA